MTKYLVESVGRALGVALGKVAEGVGGVVMVDDGVHAEHLSYITNSADVRE